MSCEICRNFPVRSSQFEELGVNEERHGTLYRCKACGSFFELIEEERSIRYTPIEELKKYYPRLDAK